MEENVGLHGSVEIEAAQSCGLVEEVCACDFAIRALLCGISDDHLDHVHLLYHVLECANVGIGNFAANGNVTESGEVLEEVIGELVACGFANDALKIFGLDETVFVAVKVREALPDALALQPSQHLGELWVGHGMPVFLAANIERSPVAFPVEGQAVLRLVRLPCLVELVEVDVARPVLVEEAENNLVLGVGFREQVLEDRPVMDVDSALPVAVGYSEEDAVLVALDFVLWRGAP